MKKFFALLCLLLVTMLATAQTEYATITVDDADFVTIMNENRMPVDAGEVAPGYYMISPTADYKFNKVTHNNCALDPNYGTSYIVELAADDVLDITAKYPVESYGIRFNDAAAIKSVTSMYKGGTEVELEIGGEGQLAYCNAVVTPGYKVVVKLNDDYKAFNDTVFYATEDVEFTTKHLVYATITCDAANMVKATEEETRESFVLAKGKNRVVTGNYIIVSNNSNYILNKVTKGDEVITAPYGYYMVEIAEGETLDVVSQWLDGDGKQLVSEISFNDVAAIKSVTAAGDTLAIVEVPGYCFTEAPQGAKVIVTLNDGYGSESNLGFFATADTYEIETYKLATIHVDVANRAKLADRYYTETVLAAGENFVKPGEYMLVAADANYTLREVKKGEEVIAETWGSRQIDLAAGDVVYITAAWLDEDGEQLESAITFNDVAAIKSITAAGDTLAIAEAEGVYFTAAPMGTKVRITLNDDYVSENALTFYAIEETYEIETTKLPYAFIHADVDYRAKAINENHEEMGLQNGYTKVLAGDYFIMSNDANYVLNKVIKGDEVIAETDGYYKVSLAEGDTLNVVSQWLDEYGDQMYAGISFNDAAAIKSITAAGDTLAIAEASGSYFTEAPMGTKVRITLNDDYVSENTLTFYATEVEYHIVTKIPYIAGDADYDEEFTVNDYNKVKNYILAPATTPATGSKAFLSADANEDKAIDASDCEKISYLSFVEAANKAPRRINNEQLIINNVEGFRATANGNQLAISATNASAFMACQMDLSINAADIKSVSTDARHRVSYSTLENGMVRVLVTSYANETFTGNEALTVTLNDAPSAGEFVIENALFTNTAFQSVKAEYAEATGISEFKTLNTELKDGKYLHKGRVIIVKDGSMHDANGVRIK